MKLVVNGEDSVFNDDLTVSELLTVKEVKMPAMVSVEINGQILKRTKFETKELEEGDKIEFLYFMGDGSGTH